MWRVMLLLTGVLVLSGLLLPVAGTAPARADTGDIGYEGPSFTGVTNPPTSSKPQSKLWHANGSWWAVMYHAASSTWHIFRLDRSSETWVDTGVRVDDRPQTLSDALADGNTLYIASHWVTVSSPGSVKTSISGRPSRLYRYTYSPTTNTYTLNTGFPVAINNYSSEALTIDKDSTGRLWASWTQVSGSKAAGYTAKVYVSHTEGSDSTWASPTTFPGAGDVAPDDISAVVAFAGRRVGVMWSNQLDGTVNWAWRNDTEPITSWRVGTAVRGSKQSDDHLNLKALMSDTQGRVYAVVKTSLDELAGAPKSSPQIRLLVFIPGTGSWTSSTFGTLADCHTRPVLVLDEQNQQVHVYATAPTSSGCAYSGAPGTIYTKSAPMTDPVFPAGRGTPVLRDASSEFMNNVTTTKQPVDASTGIVVLAANDSTHRYWHADIPVSGTPTEPPAPVSSFTATPDSGSTPLVVQLTDTSTNNPIAWSWNLGDGRTSTAQNLSVTYDSPGTYTVTLVARNASGAGSTATRTITVSSPPPPPPPGTGIVRRSAASAVSTTASPSLTIPTPAGTQAGDVLVTCLAMNGSSLTAPPAGWTRLAAPTGVSNPRVYGYYKVAGPSEPPSSVWSFAASVTSGGGTAGYSGAQGVDGSASTATGAASTTATVPGVTASVPGDMLVGCMGINSGSTSIGITGPSALAEVWDVGGKRHEYGDGVLAAAGPTGSQTWQFTSGREWAGWLVALTPR